MTSLICYNGNSINSRYDFILEPESLQYRTASRTFQNKSRSALSVQRFGRDFTYITLSGTTGFRGKTGNHNNNGYGKQKALELEHFLYTYMDLFSDDVGNNYKLIFVDTVNGKSSQVEMNTDGFNIQQSVSSPLLYTYNISLVVTGDPSQASSGEISDTLLGNSITADKNSQGALTNDQVGYIESTKGNYIDSRTMAKARIIASNEVNSVFP